jgi:peptidoglycan/LPS O-acetylase OafA/YrhL
VTTVALALETPGIEPKPSAYRPEIDGLRAIAVIAVIINHFNTKLLPSGYLGVDVFL